MTTMGVVNLNMSPHKSLAGLQSTIESNAVDSERREIIILRKKVRPINELDVRMPIIKMEPDSSTSCSRPSSSNSRGSVTNSASRGRKKPPPAPGSHQPPPLAVARRNARERNRVKQVNNGFANLRQHIPMSIAAAYNSETSGRNNKKFSKVEILRMAVDYIRSLQRLLSMDDNDAEDGSERSTSFGAVGNSPESPDVILPDSPLSPDTSSRASSYQHTPGYFYEEDTQNDASPVLIDDEEMSNIDPTSPTPSGISYQYHRLPASNTLIQLVNSPVEDLKNYPVTLQYHIDSSGDLHNLTSRDLDGGILSSVHAQQLLHGHAYVSEDGVVYSDSTADLARSSESPISVLPVSSSLSPGVRSDHSSSPSGKNDPETQSIDRLSDTSSASGYLPSFSSTLKRSSLHHLSPVTTDTVIHQSYSTSLQYTVKKELDDDAYARENDVSGSADVLTGMMNWWDQDHRLRQPTTSS